MTRPRTSEGERAIDVPDGLIHHGVGGIFMPGVTTDQAVALMQAYDSHADVFKPVIVLSKLLGHGGDRFRFYLLFYVKKIIGVTTDTEHEAVFAEHVAPNLNDGEFNRGNGDDHVVTMKGEGWFNSGNDADTLDNLLKGAATQALQNLNLAFGLAETTGIPLVKAAAT